MAVETQLTTVYSNLLGQQARDRAGNRVVIVGHALDTSPVAITAGADTLRSVRTSADITAEFAPATIDADDPGSVLPFALQRALSPAAVSTVPSSDRPRVYFVLAAGDTDPDYESAVAAVGLSEDILYIVTLRVSAAVQAAVSALAAARQTVGIRTVPVLTLPAPAAGTPASEIGSYQTAATALPMLSVPVWPHTVSWEGSPLANSQQFAAAVGGMLSISAAQQPLRNVVLETGWSSAFSSSGYRVEMLLAASSGPVGFFGLADTADADALQVVTVHTNALTPDQDAWLTALVTRELVKRRLDAALAAATLPSSGLTLAIRSLVNGELSSMQTRTQAGLLGPRFTSFTIDNVGPGANPGDPYVVTVTLNTPVTTLTALQVTVNATIE